MSKQDKDQEKTPQPMDAQQAPVTAEKTQTKNPTKPSKAAPSGKPIAEQDQQKGKTAEKPAKPTAQNHSGITWSSVLALLLAVIALLLGGYLYQQLQKQLTAASQQHEMQAAMTLQLAKVEQAVAASREKLTQEIAAREALQAQQQALTTAWENMAATLGRSSMAWRLAEVEYLLSIANHRISLARDRSTALSILQSADERLRAIGDPRLMPVRQQIADEITALRAMGDPDITGMALRLGSLISQLADLPLIDTQRIASATQTASSTVAASWRELPGVIWENIKRLVQVRRHQQPVEPLLPPREAWFLQQNLAVKLEQARLAALQQNTALFRQYLQEADAWIEQFYDQDTSAVNAARETLAQLAGVELAPTIADISGSLRSLREFLSQQGARDGSSVMQPREGAAGS